MTIRKSKIAEKNVINSHKIPNLIRKWQVALRRYVLEKNLSKSYAPYFGLDIITFREWIELQFTSGLTWDNFGSSWQLTHIVPVSYFDQNSPSDLSLCWNFSNIRVESLNPVETVKQPDSLTAIRYFEDLYKATNFEVCNQMIKKLNSIFEGLSTQPELINFINSRKTALKQLTSMTTEEMARVNRGTSLSDIFLERDILKKFG